jgi:hypothetical protein
VVGDESAEGEGKFPSPHRGLAVLLRLQQSHVWNLNKLKISMNA